VRRLGKRSSPGKIRPRLAPRRCGAIGWSPRPRRSRCLGGGIHPRRAAKIQDLYLAGDRKSAIAAVPLKLVQDVALIGPWAKITDELQRWKQTVLTTFALHADPRHLPKLADLVR
jgi:hypothetical protein